MAPSQSRANARDRETDHSWSFWFREKMLAPLLLAGILGGVTVYRKLDGMESRIDDRFTIMESRINSRMDMQDMQMKQQKEEITRLSSQVTSIEAGYISRDELLNSFKKVEQQWHIERLEKELAKSKKRAPL